MSYQSPVNAMRYLLRHGIDIEEIFELPAFAGISDDLMDDVLNGASRFCSEVLVPLNRSGDEHPARLEGADVKASPGFQEAYQAFVKNGWQSLATSPVIGGMGLPQTLSVAVNEMIYGANMAFGLCPMLTSSAIKAILAHAEPSLQDMYLPKMVTGEWSGAMNLTEPQAGSDLSAVRTKAIPQTDGSYQVSGQKIFITWGDHDCADNIIHLVLARLPDAPAGNQGLSLFLCPKILPDGSRNSFTPIRLEDKLGIHASPTCVMAFDAAQGWLIGAQNRGLACMFTMMNEARLFVGVQAVGVGEHAYQEALMFAQERVQGRVIEASDQTPIFGHPNIRRQLMEIKSALMASRAICMATAAASDRGDDVREALLTPIAKAYSSEIGVKVTSQALQVFGGMGFIEETGAAQHYRDNRITPIYEGTNGIQAIDFIGRKVRRDGGEGVQALIMQMRAIGTQAEKFTGLAAVARELAQALDVFEVTTEQVLAISEKKALSIAWDYLMMAGDCFGSALLIKAACGGFLAQDELADNMSNLARFHALRCLPQLRARVRFIESGSDLIFSPPEHFADL